MEYSGFPQAVTERTSGESFLGALPDEEDGEYTSESQGTASEKEEPREESSHESNNAPKLKMVIKPTSFFGAATSDLDMTKIDAELYGIRRSGRPKVPVTLYEVRVG